TTVAIVIVLMVIVIGTVAIALTSINPGASTSLSSHSTSSGETSTTYSTNSPSGLQLRIELNSTSLLSGSPLTAQVSLFNTLATNLSLKAKYSANPNIAVWDTYDYLCGGSFSVEDAFGFAIFQGSFASGNLSQAGNPMLLTPPVATSCPNRFYNQAYIQNVDFAPESLLATLSANASFSSVFKAQSTEMQVNATTGTCTTSPYKESGTSTEDGVTTTYSGTELAWGCGSNGANSLAGYWAFPVGAPYIQIDSESNSTITQGLSAVQANFFRTFSPGTYTIVAEDMWNQTVYGYFRVTPNPGTSTSENSLGTSSTTITGSTTLPPISWSYQGLVSAVTNSSEVKPHVTNAYYYFVMRYGAASPDGTQLFADVYVVGAQTVTGNWTTGYTMTYAERQIFNATVQYAEPSTYTVTEVAVTNLANQSYQNSFNATQKQAIGVALANSTVKADIGGMVPYFVTFADSQVNGTLGYWVQISQVNGYKNLGVLVNSDLTEVSEVVATTSYPNIGAP